MDESWYARSIGLKIAVIGAGQIGGNLALMLAQQRLGDVVFFDIPELAGMAKGKALDISQMAACAGLRLDHQGTSNWEDIDGADVVIITSGLPRKPGMSRDDLLDKNVEIMKERRRTVAQARPDAFVIIVANPLDAMVYACAEGHRVGRRTASSGRPACSTPPASATSSPWSSAVASKTSPRSCSAATATTWCRWSSSARSAASRSTSLMAKAAHRRHRRSHPQGRRRDRQPAQDRQRLLRPGGRRVAMAEAIIRDKKRVLPCAAYCDREYGIRGFFVGVPVVSARAASRRCSRCSSPPTTRRRSRHRRTMCATSWPRLDKSTLTHADVRRSSATRWEP